MSLYVKKVPVPKMFENQSCKKNHPFQDKLIARSLSARSEDFGLSPASAGLSDPGKSCHPSIPQVLIYRYEIIFPALLAKYAVIMLTLLS